MRVLSLNFCKSRSVTIKYLWKVETFQEFIDKFSSKRSSNTWKHRPAKSWDILKFERFSSFMGSKNLKPCTRQKLWRWNCLQFLKLTKLKLIPSQSWGTPKAESFSNWDLHKLKQFKGLKIHPYWMLRRRTQEFFPILENVFFTWQKMRQPRIWQPLPVKHCLLL